MIDPAEAGAAAEALKAANEFLGEIFEEPKAAIGGLIADQINHWRFSNRIRLLLKSRNFLRAKGVNPARVLPDVFLPLVEEGSNREDPSLAAMFASLLTSHLDPATQHSTHPSFTQILGQLSPLDAQMIELLHSEVTQEPHDHRKFTLKAANTAEQFGIPEAVVRLGFQNLWRLGICDQGVEAPAQASQEPRIAFTAYGYSFAIACLRHREASD